jgi:hypothetical protein
VLIVPSVFDLIWGVWDFPVENPEKLSVSILNKLGFVNDVEGCVGFLEAGALHIEVSSGAKVPGRRSTCAALGTTANFN